MVKHSGAQTRALLRRMCHTRRPAMLVLARAQDDQVYETPSAIELWDLKAKRLDRSLPYPAKFVNAIAQLNEPGKILTASNEVAVWDVFLSPLRSLHSAPVTGRLFRSPCPRMNGYSP